MKGSTKFWIAIGILVWGYCCYSVWPFFDNKSNADEGMEALWIIITAAYFLLEMIFGMINETIYGPFSYLGSLIIKFNKLLDKHFSDGVHKMD